MQFLPHIRRMALIIPLLFFIPAVSVFAHPVSLSEATLDMHKDHIDVTLRIMVEDLSLYYELEANEDYYIPPQAIRDAIQIHQQFMLQYFSLFKEDGTKLVGEITEIVEPEMGEKGVHISELMAHYVDYKATYRLEEPLDFVTVLQEFGGQESWVPASMWLIVQREGELYYPPFTLAKGIPNSLRIDWDKPPLPPESEPEAREKWFEEQSEATLGFTSYSAVYSFIYVTETEVRHEILMPLLTLESWLELDRKDLEFIEVEEQDAALEKIEAFYREHAPVEIDGVPVKPVLSRLDFYGLDFNDFAQQAPRKKLNVYSARVGAILSYPAKGIPDTVAINWDLFNEYVPMLFSMVYAFNTNEQFVFTWETPELKWENPGLGALPTLEKIAPPEGREMISVPLYSALCIVALAFMLTCMIMVKQARRFIVLLLALALGAGAFFLQSFGMTGFPDYSKPAFVLDETSAGVIVESLQKNIYRAFDYGTENDVYDALAQSVDGDLLTNLYLQIRSSLAMQEQGGAISHVESIEFSEGALDELHAAAGGAPAFAYTASWNVEGTVEHWGHIHTRRNGYTAQFTVEAVDGAWKITGLNLLEDKRLGFKTRLRTLSTP